MRQVRSRFEARPTPVFAPLFASLFAPLFFLILASSACTRAPDVPRDEQALFQTPALRYALTRDELGFRATIPWTFHNQTGEAVYFVNCDGDVRPLLQMRRNGSWFDAWTPFRSMCVSPPIVVAPGASLADTLMLFGAPAGSNVVPAFAFEEVGGVVRLLWDQVLTRYDGATVDPTAILPVARRISNRFVLTR